jgi:hypothetical protein
MILVNSEKGAGDEDAGNPRDSEKNGDQLLWEKQGRPHSRDPEERG